MKVHRVELLIVDHDQIGQEVVVDVLENTRYPNRCIYPRVMQIDTREIDWTDDHPFNEYDDANASAAYRKLFGASPFVVRWLQRNRP